MPSKLTVASIIVFLASTALILNDDLMKIGLRNVDELQPIAKMSKLKNDVRRKLVTDFSMRKVTDEVVYNEDTIYTGESSQVLIILNDGTEIQMSENSLIFLEGSGADATLNVLDGNFRGKLGSQTKIAITDKAGKKKIIKNNPEAGKKQAELKINVSEKNGEAQVSVFKGKIEVDANNKKEIVENNQVVKVDQEEVKIIDKLEITLLGPNLGEKVSVTPKRKVSFEWDFLGQKTGDFLVEISYDEKFTNLFGKKKTDKTKVNLVNLPCCERLYWRVKVPTQKKELVSQLSYFDMQKSQGPILLSPSPRQQFRVKNPKYFKPEVDLTFRWEDPYTTQSDYHFQIARDQTFQDIERELTTKMIEAEVTKLKVGEYFWRVQTVDGEIRSPWSNVRQVYVLEYANPGHLILPEDSRDFDLKRESVPLAFKWKQFSPNETYVMEVSQSESFEKVISKKKLSKNDYDIQWKKPGEFYWRVSYFDGEKRDKVSETFRFNINDLKLKKPRPSPLHYKLSKDILEEEKRNIRFKWADVERAEGYTLEVRNSDGQRVHKVDVDKSEYLWRNPVPGSFSWKVLARDRENYAGPWSRKGSAFIEPPTPPVLAEEQVEEEVIEEEIVEEEIAEEPAEEEEEFYLKTDRRLGILAQALGSKVKFEIDSLIPDGELGADSDTGFGVLWSHSLNRKNKVFFSAITRSLTFSNASGSNVSLVGSTPSLLQVKAGFEWGHTFKFSSKYSFGMSDKVFVSSFSNNVLTISKKLSPELSAGVSYLLINGELVEVRSDAGLVYLFGASADGAKLKSAIGYYLELAVNFQLKKFLIEGFGKLQSSGQKTEDIEQSYSHLGGGVAVIYMY